MARMVAVNESSLVDACDAIREQLGVQTTYMPSEMADAIASITGGGGGAKNILNGTTEPTSADGSDGDIYLKYVDVTSLPTGATALKSITTAGGNKGNGFTSDFYFTPDTEIVFDGKVSSAVYDGWQSLLGVRNTTPVYSFYTRCNNGTNKFAFETGSSTSAVISSLETGIYDEDVTITIDSSGARWTNGIDSYSLSVSPSLPTTGYVRFFSTDYTGAGAAEQGKYTVYSIRVYEDGTITHKYIPVRDSSNVVCLYDTVGGTYCYPDSGVWTAGAELADDSITATYLKVNGSWLSLIGQDIDNVNTGA